MAFHMLPSYYDYPPDPARRHGVDFRVFRVVPLFEAVGAALFVGGGGE